MPIDYKEYHPKWSLISRLIRFKRANNRCEFCGVLNKSLIKRLGKMKFRQLYANEIDMVFSRVRNKHTTPTESLKHYGFTKIVLTVAHLDHDKNNNRFHNLAALCQSCHLHHDRHHHANSLKYGRNHKNNQIQLFGNPDMF